ncbi:unnamed protein product [Chrysodeixis includens]|uniref:BHLH domain-containing protein n=1 Tax=Chrysodeixis includens TaxID=689277 RepID=A0A9P0FWL2_CHRIL|nr:unnamed protein product [Chrysodeixis includens]
MLVMEAASSKRTPSRCREWERRRRDKFNEALTQLLEIVKRINKTNCQEEVEDVQYSKIEIIQKAIVCLSNYDQEKTQMKAEILALQVKLTAETDKFKNRKDASTQVYIGLNKKRKGKKYVKLLMLKKGKNKDVPEKLQTKKPPPPEPPRKLPMLLPRSSFINNKKGPENTIVVLPAAPYIFPQRPLLFPSVPPAIVLIDQNLQPINKAPLPIVNRNNGDITKTTMVNILPISAYSRPLSASKSKKTSVKLKNNVSKKSTKTPKATAKTAKDTSKSKSNEVKNVSIDNSKENSKTKSENSMNNNKEIVNTEKTVENKVIPQKETVKVIDIQKVENISNATVPPKLTSDIIIPKSKEQETQNVVDKPKCADPITKKLPTTDPPPVVTTTESITNIDTIKTTDNIIKHQKTVNDKIPIPENKEKENKLPNILPLDTTLCDNVVDGGNARLELAEEFLATSPTAAFLMSFPLVSGNRADSPAEEQPTATTQANVKDNQKRPELVPPPPVPYFEKPNNDAIKLKPTPTKPPDSCNTANKQNDQQKCATIVATKESSTSTTVSKSSNTAALPSVSSENPFLNLSMPSIIPSNSTLPDNTFGIDFECNITKSMPSQSTGYASGNNFFYKSDPFGKSAIYSTSSITSSHEFNGIGLYPCAMEKYGSKNKPDYSSVDDNLMKIGSSRLTYDIDLGWSHKGLDFVNCTTTTNTFNKDTILTTTSTPYTTSYNPFNPEFHTPLVSNSNKKENTIKPSSSFADTITSFYSQPANLWTEEVPFYTNSNASKTLPPKNQNYPTFDPVHTNANVKLNTIKHYEPKVAETSVDTGIKPTNNVVAQHNIPEKYTKKSPTKMHINWMTSETRSVQNHCNPIHPELKETHKAPVPYHQPDHSAKKQDHNEGNYFPLPMHNFPTQTPQDEFQVWPSTRPLGTTEISIDPPPINLPTLVGDLALGPHDKNRKLDVTNRGVPQADLQNCGNFLSVTQLMNRSTDNMPSRYHPNIDPSKPPPKQNINHFPNESNRKAMSHLENQMPQPCYVFNDPKIVHTYDSMAQFPASKSKSNKTEKSSKTQKNNYSTEALLRGANGPQKIQDSNSAKFMIPPQKYSDFVTPQDSAVAQVSHFPPILDYSDNSYASQQFSGTTLYNTTTNTMSNSFYSNFMPGSSNLMSGNYTSGPFTGEFIDYNQTSECNYANHKYEELKMRNNPTVFQSEKVPSTYKSSRKESAAKHKLECSKKESSKKYQSKKAKIHNEMEEWNDPHLLWQNKALSKKHPNLMSEELPFPNYVGNQMPTQYQADFFNSHLMPTNVQSMGHNVDRSLASFPVTSRANFNLSTIFPEITMKVQ